MLRKILSKRGKGKGADAAAEEAKANVDLSKCLAQAQEILGKLRQGKGGQDPFPSLNEASRIGEQMRKSLGDKVLVMDGMNEWCVGCRWVGSWTPNICWSEK